METLETELFSSSLVVGNAQCVELHQRADAGAGAVRLDVGAGLEILAIAVEARWHSVPVRHAVDRDRQHAAVLPDLIGEFGVEGHFAYLVRRLSARRTVLDADHDVAIAAVIQFHQGFGRRR